jgi:flagellar protein FlaF
MQSPAHAYGKVAKQVASPRELEATLLLQAASRLQAVQAAWDHNSSELGNALLYNRKLWTIFLASATDQNSPLAKDLRQNVANLGLFVMKQTMAITGDPRPEQLAPLININRELAAGLLGRA